MEVVLIMFYISKRHNVMITFTVDTSSCSYLFKCYAVLNPDKETFRVDIHEILISKNCFEHWLYGLCIRTV